MMLNEQQIKKLVIVRLSKLQGCKDHNYLWHHIGVIRGLLWVLTGKDQGDLSRTDDILDVMGVPYDTDPRTDQVVIPNEWLEGQNIKI